MRLRPLTVMLLTTYLASAWFGYVWAAFDMQQPPVPDSPIVEPHDPTTGCAREADFKDDLRLFACACHPITEGDGESCARVGEDNKCLKYCRKDLCFCTVTCEHPAAGVSHLLGHLPQG